MNYDNMTVSLTAIKDGVQTPCTITGETSSLLLWCKRFFDEVYGVDTLVSIEFDKTATLTVKSLDSEEVLMTFDTTQTDELNFVLNEPTDISKTPADFVEVPPQQDTPVVEQQPDNVDAVTEEKQIASSKGKKKKSEQ